MKNKLIKFIMVGLIGMFAADAMSIPVVHYSREKKKCGIFGCNSTSIIKDEVILHDGSTGLSIDIECYGAGFSICPRGIAYSEEPEELDNRPEMLYILGYIDDEVNDGNTQGNETVNVASQDGSVWAYSVVWNVEMGEGEVVDESFTIERLIQVVQ